MISGYADKRRREFTASRRCARKALAALGITGFPLLPGPNRAPMWPPSVVGSITHTDGCADGYCGVVVADRRLTLGLGVDAEPNLPLPAELWPRVLDDEERSDALAAVEPGTHARLVFSAKETTYKALYPAFGHFIEFSDVHIHVQYQEGVFFANLAGTAAGIGLAEQRLVGRLAVDNELIVTAMVLPAPGLPLALEALSLHHVSC